MSLALLASQHQKLLIPHGVGCHIVVLLVSSIIVAWNFQTGWIGCIIQKQALCLTEVRDVQARLETKV